MSTPGPPPAMQMLSLRALAAEPYRLLSHGRLRRACNDGQLHGHQRAEKVPWQVALEVALAWRGGASYAEQKRICPMCSHLNSIPDRGTRHLKAVPAGGGR